MTENKALDTLLNILKTSGADAWEVTDEKERGWEFYLMRWTRTGSRKRKVSG